jgi:hypothetical protein
MSDVDELRSIARWLLDNHIPISVSRLTAIADNVERQQSDLREAVELLRRIEVNGILPDEIASDLIAFLARIKL